MNRKSRVKKLIITAIALLLIVYVISSTYARYATSGSGTASASVAKWAVTLKSGGNTITTNTPITFTIDDNDNVVDNKIAPGTTATATVELDLSGTEVAVDFLATVGEVAGLPSGLHLTSSVTGGTSGSTVTFDLPSGDAFPANTTKTVTLTLTWDAGSASGDSGDTTFATFDGTTKEITIPVTLTATQHIGSGS